MPLIGEAAPASPQLSSVLDAGIATLSSNQSITFQQYTKVALEQDGSVFWVATGGTANFSGSLHYITDRKQDEDETVAANRFIFTAMQEVTAFNVVSPSTLWIGTWMVDGAALKIAFADRGSFYQQADLWHYSGYAVYPAMASQLVQSEADLPDGPIVSNSLPVFMGLPSSPMAAIYPILAFAPIYPSHLVPDNITPPYVVVHIDPGSTTALQQVPVFDWKQRDNPNSDPSPLYQLSSWQLMRDTVRLVLYGFNNQQALRFQAALIDYSRNTDVFGFCSPIVVRDEKRTQVEIAALAMKKTLDFQASYYQATADAVARRLILSALINVSPQE